MIIMIICIYIYIYAYIERERYMIIIILIIMMIIIITNMIYSCCSFSVPSKRAKYSPVFRLIFHEFNI